MIEAAALPAVPFVPGHDTRIIGYARHHTADGRFVDHDVLECVRCRRTFFRALGDTTTESEIPPCTPAVADGGARGMAGSLAPAAASDLTNPRAQFHTTGRA